MPKVISKSILTIIALISFGLTTFVYKIIIGKFYSPSVLGEIGLVLDTSMIFSLAVSAGFAPAASKFISEHIGREELGKAKRTFYIILKYMLVFGFVLTILFVLASFVISSMFSIEFTLFLIASLIVITYISRQILRGSLYGIEKIKKYLLIELIADAIFFISLIFFIFLDIPVEYTLLSFALSHAIFSLIAFMSVESYFKGVKIENLEKSEIKNILRYSALCVIGTYASSSRYRFATPLTGILLIHLGSMTTSMITEQLGYLQAAMSIAVILSLIPQAFSNVLLPDFSKLYGMNKTEKIKELYLDSFTKILLISAFLCSVGILLSQEILTLFYSEEYLNSVRILKIYILSYFVIMVSVPANSILSGTKYVKIPNLAGVVSFFITLILWIILVPQFSITGTVISILAGSIADTLVTIGYSHRKFEIKVGKESLLLLILPPAFFIISEMFISLFLKILLLLILALVLILGFSKEIKEMLNEVRILRGNKN